MNSRKIKNVIGPPGTGKTTYCINTAKNWLEKGHAPGQIGYFAFTKNAAEEAKTRIFAQTEWSADDLIWFRTLHSAAYRMIGMTQDKVANNRVIGEFAKTIGIPYDPFVSDLDSLYEGNAKEGNLLMQVWDFGRNRELFEVDAAWEVAPEALTLRCDRNNFRSFIRKYEEYKKRKGLMDFTDMLIEAQDCGDTTGCSHVIIDELQDLTPLQWKMANLCCEDATRVLRAGDDDQQIFSWAGVRSEDFLNADGEKEVLEQSHRVPKTVWTEAMKVIRRNHRRIEKAYRPRNEEGRFTRRLSEDLPALNEAETSAFLYRNKKHLSEQGKAWMEAGIPFTSNRFATPLSNPVTIAGLLAAYRWQEKGSLTSFEALALLDMVKSGSFKGEVPYGASQALYREAKAKPFSQITDLALTPEGMRVLRNDPVQFVKNYQHQKYLKKLISKSGIDALQTPPKLHLTTIHGAKGAEFDHVYISQDCLRNCSDGISEDPEEETRLKYVGITRARKTCTVLSPVAEGGWEI